MDMESSGLLVQALILLGGAVIAAPLFRWLGLGTVLGYLAAGVVIGPAARLITGGEDILHVAELGVVFLLFVIGLELKPSRLWALRRAIFGLGAAQVLVTGVVLAALAHFLAGLALPAAVLAGFGLALSSTAVAMQILDADGARNQRYGQTAFSVLLFQDLAIVPLLALIPLFAPDQADGGGLSFGGFALAIAAIAALVLAGRYLLNPLFRIIANAGAREAMIAAALFVVIGAGALLQTAGLSMGMGAFIAGVMLAESSYRHELEADIEPFRGILLGLFFMAVGLSLDLGVIVSQWPVIVIAVPLMMAVKAMLLALLMRITGHGRRDSVKTALLLSQGGEFGFVLFSAAAAANLVGAETASLLVGIVTLSMALTPLAVRLSGLLLPAKKPETMEEDFEGAGADVLMIGFSRFGQIAAQALLAGGSDVTIIDHSADRVRTVANFGFKIYFGDGTRKDVLEAAGIRQARLVAVCTRDKDVTTRIVKLIQSEYPEVRLYVRSYDRVHALELREMGVDYEIRETFESGLVFGRKTLEALGMDETQAYAITEDVRRRDAERLALQATEGITAGREKLYRKPVTPEPLIKPQRESQRLDKPEAEDSRADA